MDECFLPMNLNVHLDKHLGSVQMADVQPFPDSCTEGLQWAPAAVFISAQDRGRQTLKVKKECSFLFLNEASKNSDITLHWMEQFKKNSSLLLNVRLLKQKNLGLLIN